MNDLPEHLTDTAADVIKPDWDLMGWGEKDETDSARLENEQKVTDAAIARCPSQFVARAEKKFQPEFHHKISQLMKRYSYEEGSTDLCLVDEIVYGQRVKYRQQKTGSCTISNAFRCWRRRADLEVVGYGQLEDGLGKKEWTPDTGAFYAPLSYGIAREIGGLRRGDGGFCGSTIESLMGGVLDCNDPDLLTILKQLGSAENGDFPEPISNSTYRTFQNWTYNDRLKSNRIAPLIESERVTDVQRLAQLLGEWKPCLMCSMLAVKFDKRVDGMATYTIDRSDRWAHAMCWCGRIKFGGKAYLLLSNESWPNQPVYPIEISIVEEIFRIYRPEILSMGEIDLPDAKIAA